MNELVNELKSYDLSEEAKTLGIDVTEDNLKVMDEDKACYFLKLLNSLKEDKESINALCDKQIKINTESIEKFRESKVSTIDKQISYLENILKDFAHYKLDNSKKQSLALPYGTLQFRKNKDTFEYDTDMMKNYLNANPLFASKFLKSKTEVSIDKKELVKALKYDEETGKVFLNSFEVPDVTFKEGQVSFFIK